jgi:hypothetical protein
MFVLPYYKPCFLKCPEYIGPSGPIEYFTYRYAGVYTKKRMKKILPYHEDPPPYTGKTYSLYGGHTGTERYYRTVKKLTDELLHYCPDEKRLLSHVQMAGSARSFFKKPSEKNICPSLISFIKKEVKASLSLYTKNVKRHLRTLPISQRFDRILKTREEQYYLYMVEIELTNRIYKDQFKHSAYKFSLIAHCLRDFRPECQSTQGDIESECAGCTRECFVHLGSVLLKKYEIHPYISVTMDLEKLFRNIKAAHQSIGALGIACVPELAQGMRLCVKSGIPPVGIPLDANRCARWMQHARETSFSLKELEALIQ